MSGGHGRLKRRWLSWLRRDGGVPPRVPLYVEELEGRTLLTAGFQETFVATLYHAALHRDASAADESYWAGALAAGTLNRTQVATGIFRSDAAHAQDIAKDYRTFLGRDVDSAGLNFWTKELNQGATLEKVVAGIAGSNEFFARVGGTTDDFLEILYREELHRDLDAAGKAYFGGELNGGVGRTTVAGQIVGSEEAERVRIGADYAEELGRPADRAGLDYWAAQAMKFGRRDEEIAGAIAGADEYSTAITAGLAALDTDDPNLAATALDRRAGRFTAEEGPDGATPGQAATQLAPYSGGLQLNATTSNTNPSGLLTVTNVGPVGTLLHYQASGLLDGPNGVLPLTLDQPQGTLGSELSALVHVSANAAGLPAGTYNGSVTVTDTTGAAAAQTVPVTLTVGSDSSAGTGGNNQAAANAFLGTYTGIYQGAAFDPNAHTVAVSGNLTLIITGVSAVAGTSTFAVTGTIQATNFFGQTVTSSFASGQQRSGGAFEPRNSRAIISGDRTTRPLIQLVGIPSDGGFATLSGGPGHYKLTGAINITDAHGDVLGLPLSSFTLTQNG